MEKEPLYINEAQIETDLNDSLAAQQAGQTVLDEFKSLNLEIKIKSVEQLKALTEQSEDWIKKQIEASLDPTTTLFGLKVKRRAAIDLLIELPDFTRLNNLVKDFRPYLFYLPNLKIENGILSFKEDPLVVAIRQNTIIAKTKDQKELRITHQQAAEALTRLNQAIKAAGLIRINGESPIIEYFNFKYSSHTGDPISLEVTIREEWYRKNLAGLME